MLEINVTRVNDAPVFTGQKAIYATEDIPFTLFLDSLSFSDDTVGQGTHSLHVREGIGYSFEGNQVTTRPNLNGTVGINAVIYDGEDTSAVFSIQVYIYPQNDMPVVDSVSPVVADCCYKRC